MTKFCAQSITVKSQCIEQCLLQYLCNSEATFLHTFPGLNCNSPDLFGRSDCSLISQWDILRHFAWLVSYSTLYCLCLSISHRHTHAVLNQCSQKASSSMQYWEMFWCRQTGFAVNVRDTLECNLYFNVLFNSGPTQPWSGDTSWTNGILLFYLSYINNLPTLTFF